MNRIDKTFQRLAAEKRKALIAFLTAGDPDFETSRRIMLAACTAGVDLLEIGVPFSDPTCDGPVIQQASERALKNGNISFARSLQLAATLRQESETPIVLFSYYNLVFKYGLTRAAQDAERAGVDGLLIVDLPPEEAHDLASALTAQAQTSGAPPIHLIRLAAPTTRPERIRFIAEGAGGFLYLISRTGVTGTGGLDYTEVAQHASEVKSLCRLPVCIGFGISSAADARILAPMVDGIIVGSAIVRLIAEATPNVNLPEIIADKISELRQGLDSGAKA